MLFRVASYSAQMAVGSLTDQLATDAIIFDGPEAPALGLTMHSSDGGGPGFSISDEMPTTCRLKLDGWKLVE
jgi:hypothetical protein